MRIAVVVSRPKSFKDLSEVERSVADFMANIYDAEVVSGGASGVDSLAVRAAEAKGLKTKVFLPNWDRHGRSAGPIRNKSIVDYCDRLVAFWDGKSKGTEHSISLAKKAGKQVDIFMFESNQSDG